MLPAKAGVNCLRVQRWKKMNKKMFKTLANWKIVSIFAPRFSDE